MIKKTAIALAALFAVSAAPAAAQGCYGPLHQPHTMEELLKPLDGKPFGVLIMLQKGSPLMEMMRTEMPHNYGTILNREVGGDMIFAEGPGMRIAEKTPFDDFPVIGVRACLRPGADLVTVMKAMTGKNGIEAVAPDTLMYATPAPVQPQP